MARQSFSRAKAPASRGPFFASQLQLATNAAARSWPIHCRAHAAEAELWHTATLPQGCYADPACLGLSRFFLKTTALGHLQCGNEGRNVIYFGQGDNFRPWNAAVLADALLLMDALPFQEQNKGRTRRVAGSLPAQPRLSCCQVFLFGSISHHLLLSCFN